MLDIIHQAWLLRNFGTRGWHLGKDGVVVLQERKFNALTGRNEVTVTLVEGNGALRERHHAMRIYSAPQLVRMVRRAGLAVEAAYGALDGQELTLDSKPLVLLARR